MVNSIKCSNTTNDKYSDHRSMDDAFECPLCPNSTSVSTRIVDGQLGRWRCPLCRRRRFFSKHLDKIGVRNIERTFSWMNVGGQSLGTCRRVSSGRTRFIPVGCLYWISHRHGQRLWWRRIQFGISSGPTAFSVFLLISPTLQHWWRRHLGRWSETSIGWE